VDYDSTKSGWVLSALLGVDLNTRVGNLEGGSALTVNTTGTGNAITSISKAGTVITATKGLTFSLDGHTHAYLPLAGGTMSNTNLVTNLNADLLDGLHKTAFPQYFHYSTTSSGSGWYKIKILSTTSWMVAITVKLYQSYGYNEIVFSGYQYGANYWYSPNAILKTSSGTSITVHFGYDSASNLWVAVSAGNYTGMDVYVTNGYSQVADWSKNISVTKEATLTGTIQKTQTIYRPLNYNENALSATKLQTARTIAGVSFDGTANIAIPFANLSNKPTTLGGYGITDAVTLNTPQEITGAKTFTAGMLATTITSNYWFLNDSSTNPYLRLTRADQNWYLQAVTSGVALGSILSKSILVTSEGRVGIGTTSPSEKLHVVGNILATGTTTTTKVIFNAAGWSMEQVGTELQMKHNNVLKMRFTSAGSIVATEEITAFG
jgi:hypothetical protein